MKLACPHGCDTACSFDQKVRPAVEELRDALTMLLEQYEGLLRMNWGESSPAFRGNPYIATARRALKEIER